MGENRLMFEWRMHAQRFYEIINSLIFSETMSELKRKNGVISNKSHR